MAHWITLSHSSRPLDFSRLSRASLETRFKNTQRLASLPRFAELGDADAPRWANNISVWTWCERGLNLVSFVQRNHTVNHALVEGMFERLIICAHDHLEVCSIDGELQRTTSHPWFAGGHTVYPNRDGNYDVSCSGSDAILTIDRTSLDIIETWRMPAGLYGMNYQLSLDDDVRRQYIKTDFQISHINSAFPSRDSVLITCFIQGSILRKDSRGICTELISGHVGCHGARQTDDGHIYFADSTRGEIVWIGKYGQVAGAQALGSCWLHDAVWLSQGHYACSIGDRNQLAIVDAGTGRVVEVQGLDAFGGTPCLLSSGRL